MAGVQTDIIGVYDAQFSPLFGGAIVGKATVKEDAKVMEHPIESGAMVTDFFVINPVEIEIRRLLRGDTARETYQQIKEAFTAGDLLTVQTRAGSYSDMLIASISHDEPGEYMGRIDLTMLLKEAKFVSAKYAPIKPEKPKQASTKKRGEQKPKAVTKPEAEKSSAAYDIFYGKK